MARPAQPPPAAQLPRRRRSTPLPAPSFPIPLQLGGKGANLCEMAHLGLNVPPGFTITTKVCQVRRF